jgi:hypothetical protein
MRDETKEDRMEHRMKMWKMRQEMLNSMGEKELRAFISGYIMSQSMMLRKMGSRHGHGFGCGHGCGCGSECNCKGGSCNCENK